MAFPTAVNSQITDSVSQIPPYDGATAELFSDLIRAFGIASKNGISEQHQATIIKLALSMSGIHLLENKNQP